MIKPFVVILTFVGGVGIGSVMSSFFGDEGSLEAANQLNSIEGAVHLNEKRLEKISEELAKLNQGSNYLQEIDSEQNIEKISSISSGLDMHQITLLLELERNKMLSKLEDLIITNNEKLLFDAANQFNSQIMSSVETERQWVAEVVTNLPPQIPTYIKDEDNPFVTKMDNPEFDNPPM